MVRMAEATTTDRQHRRLVLGLCALVLVLVGLKAAVLSGAAFSWSSANSFNVVAAGDLRLTNDHDGVAVVTASHLRPGQELSGQLTVTGDDETPAALHIRAATLQVTPSSSTIAHTLQLVVEDVTATSQVVYNGPLDGLTALDLGTLGAGEARALRFSVSFPTDAADPALQGHSADLTVQVAGVQL